MKSTKKKPPVVARKVKPVVLRPVDWLPSELSDKLFEEAWRAKKWSLANATPTADYENAKLFWDMAWQMSRVALTKNPTGQRTGGIE